MAGMFQGRGIFQDTGVSQVAAVRRLWLLVPKKSNAYVPGFEGTFEEALTRATENSAYWETPYEVWEADPQRYRTAGGMVKLWATISVPKDSPLRPRTRR